MVGKLEGRHKTNRQDRQNAAQMGRKAGLGTGMVGRLVGRKKMDRQTGGQAVRQTDMQKKKGRNRQGMQAG